LSLLSSKRPVEAQTVSGLEPLGEITDIGVNSFEPLESISFDMPSTSNLPSISINKESDGSLFSNDQTIFLIILIQFIVVMLISKYYLKKEIYRSDFAGLIILIFGFLVSEYHLFSNYFKLQIPSHEIKKQSIGPISQSLNPKNTEFETNIVDKPNEINNETNELDDKNIQDDRDIDINLNEE
jgi:hypothetical protein